MTDFGQDDFFVPSVKAVLLSLNPAARLVDITHTVPAYDIRAAGFILAACAPFFPAGTIFLSIVDPGVGSDRRVLLARTDRHDFIAPDNGLLTRALAGAASLEVRAVTSGKFFLARTSRTFEGRDKMAPAAAWLSLGTPASEFGPLAAGYVKLPLRRPVLEGGGVRGEVAYIDKFGNLITDIPSSWLERPLPASTSGRRLRLRLKGRTVDAFPGSYAAAVRGRLIALPGSLGTIEISLRQDSAAARLKARVGDEVRLAPR